VSKASRLFRFRAHRETTLAALLPAISLLPRPADTADESHETTCQMAECEPVAPSATIATTEVSLKSIPEEVWASFPHAITEPVLDAVDMSDPLAILRQTIAPGPTVEREWFPNFAVSSLGSILRAADSLSSSVEPDDATLIGAKVHCEVSVPGTFLTETMDLEAIAASAREAATTSATLSGITYADHPSASETVKEEIIAEVSAVAEEFVAEQRQHAQAQPAHAVTPEPPKDRRRKRRALISAPIRVRSVSAASGFDEIATTVDVSRTGILFHTQLDAYTRGIEVAVVFPYSQAPGALHAEQTGQVVRVSDLGNGMRAVAVALCATTADVVAVVDAPAGAAEPRRDSAPAAPETKKPLVLAVDADESLRDTLKIYLQNEGYDVIAVNNAADAREVLNIFTPALIIAEVEGEGTPGYDLCAYVKSNPSMRRVPVVLTTSSAYPSDYSHAHALGAIVCMAKPYKQERLGHVVRLLVPLPEHLQNIVAPHTADPTRVPGRDGNSASRNLRLVRGNGSAKKCTNNGSNGKIRFRFPSFR
jgi:two-component system, chemotaxis family, response regulator PixH